MNIFRQFYCGEDDSTVTISYKYVYCRSYAQNFQTYLSVDVNGVEEQYQWYDIDGGYNDSNVPINASVSSYGISGATSILRNSESNLLQCVDNSDEDQMINAINVSYQYSSKVNSSEPILVHIYSMMKVNEFWMTVVFTEYCFMNFGFNPD